jgi:TipAS antibiotic-recognition domain
VEGVSVNAAGLVLTGFDEEAQRRHEKQASRRRGEKCDEESWCRWDGYSREKQAAILAEAEAICRELVEHVDEDPASEPVQQAIARWHEDLHHAPEPKPEILNGLGQVYGRDTKFRPTFPRTHTDLPDGGKGARLSEPADGTIARARRERAIESVSVDSNA